MTESTAPLREFTLTRTIDAPRELVFQAWTEPAHLGWFFNPSAIPDEPPVVDLRVGGAWRQRMTVDKDTDYVTGGIYRELIPGEKLVFTWGASDGWPPVDPARPEEGIVITVAMDERAGKTAMVFQLVLPPGLSDDDVREWLAKGIRDGWNMTLDRLVARFGSPGVSE